MKQVFKVLQKSGCYIDKRGRKSLILLASYNGIKIAYREAASDAQALCRYPSRGAMRNTFRRTESSDPTRLARSRNKRSPKLERQRTFSQGGQ
jgi:hypothetical protein